MACFIRVDKRFSESGVVFDPVPCLFFLPFGVRLRHHEKGKQCTRGKYKGRQANSRN
jgi:hypothetical protein